MSETNELIKASQILSKVGMMDSKVAADSLTSSLNGYGIASSEVMSIIDKMTAIDVEAATSTEELAKALSETATSAKLSGMSIDSILAKIATVSSVTRDGAESIGHFFKTFTARMQEVKLGKLEFEGEDISNVEVVLEKYNIALRDSQLEFRNLDDVLSDVAGKWDSLASAQKREIATQLAGKLGMEKFLVLMSNWKMATDLQKVSLDSAGSAQERFAIYLESLAAKLTEFTNAFQGLTMATIDSGFLAWIIELGTGILNLVTSMGGLGPILTTVVGLLVANKASGFAQFISNVGQSIVSLIPNTKLWAAAQAEANAQMNAGKIAASGFGLAVNSILGVVGALVAVFSVVSMAINGYNSKMAENRRVVLESSKANLDQIKSLDEVKSKIQDEATSREDLVRLIGGINSKYGEEVGAIKDVNDARAKSIELIDAEAIAIAEKNLEALGPEYSRAKNILKEQVSTGSGLFAGTREETIASLSESLDIYNEKVKQGIELNWFEQKAYEQLSNAYNKLKGEVDGANQVIDEWNFNLDITEGKARTYTDAIDELSEATPDTLPDGGLTETGALYENLTQKLSKTTKEYDLLTAALSENNVEGKVSSETYKALTDLNADYSKMLTKTIGGYKLNTSAAEAMRERLGAVRKILGDTKVAYTDFQNALKTPTKAEGTYDVLNQAVKTLKDGLKSGMTETDEFYSALNLLFGETPPTDLPKSLKNLEVLFGSGADGAEKMYKKMRKFTKDGVLDMDKFQKSYSLSDEAMAGLLDKWEELGLIPSLTPSFDTIANGMGLTAKQAVNLESKLKDLYAGIQAGDISEADSEEKLEKILKGYKLSESDKNEIRKNWRMLNEGLSLDTVTAFTGLTGDVETAIQGAISSFVGKKFEIDLLSGITTGEINLEDLLDTGALEIQLRRILKEIGGLSDAEISNLLPTLVGRTISIALKTGIDTSIDSLNLGEELSQKVSDAIMQSYDPTSKQFNIKVAVNAMLDDVNVDPETAAKVIKAIEEATDKETGEVDLKALTATLGELNLKDLGDNLPSIITGLQELNKQSAAQVTKEIESAETKLAAALSDVESLTTAITDLDAVPLSNLTGQIAGITDSANTSIEAINSLAEKLTALNAPNVEVTVNTFKAGENATVESPTTPTEADISAYNEADGGATVEEPSKQVEASINKYSEVPSGAKVDDPKTMAEAFIEWYKGENAGIDPPPEEVEAYIRYYKTGVSAGVQPPQAMVEAFIRVYKDKAGDNVDPPEHEVMAFVGIYNEITGGAVVITPSLNSLTGYIVEYNDENAKKPKPEIIVEVEYDVKPRIGGGGSTSGEQGVGRDSKAKDTTFEDVEPVNKYAEALHGVQEEYHGLKQAKEEFEQTPTIEPPSAPEFKLDQSTIDKIDAISTVAGDASKSLDDMTKVGLEASDALTTLDVLGATGGFEDMISFATDFAAALERGEKPTEEQITQMQSILKLLESLKSLGIDSINFEPLASGLSGVFDQDFTGEIEPAISALQSLVDAANEVGGATDGISNVNSALSATSKNAETATDSMSGLNSTPLSGVKGQVNNVNSAVKTTSASVDVLQQKLNTLNGTNVNVSVNTSGGVPTGGAAAVGTKNAKGGPTLVDDGNGAELIEHRKTGTFELGTDNGPRIAVLDKGDVVHTAEETKKILKHSSLQGKYKKISTGDAFAKGTLDKLSDDLLNIVSKMVIAGAGGGGSSSSASAPRIPSSSGSSSGSRRTSSGSSGSSSSNKKKENSYQKQLDELRHLYAMEKISAEEFYRRLGELNDKYNKDRKNKLKEYRSILEEIYAWEKEQLLNKLDMQMDYANMIRDAYDQDHEEYKRQSEELLRLQLEKQKVIEDKLAHYRALGFAEDSEILMDLKRQWYEIELWKREEIIKTKELELSKYETTTNAVISLIDDEIEKLNEQKDALKEANKAQEKKIELAELEENLMRARRSRTMRIYREGIGFVFEQDTKAIEDAEKALRDFNLQQQIDAIDASIKAWEKYKKQWQDVARDYQKSQDALIAAQILGADWESQILSQRLDILGQFRDNYIRIQQEILAAQNAMIAMEQATANATLPGFVEITEKINWFSELIPGNVKIQTKKYATGTRSSKRGIANVDELSPELIVGPQKGRYTYLEAGSNVMTANLANNLFTMAQDPVKWIKDSLSKILPSNSIINNPNNKINIGDIYINNPIGDSNALARELNNTLGTKGLQVIFSK